MSKNRYRKKQDNGQCCDCINLPIVINETDEKYTINHTSNDVFLYDKTFEIEYVIFDQLTNLTKTENILPGLPIFDWSKVDFNFNVPVNITLPVAATLKS